MTPSHLIVTTCVFCLAFLGINIWLILRSLSDSLRNRTYGFAIIESAFLLLFAYLVYTCPLWHGSTAH